MSESIRPTGIQSPHLVKHTERAQHTEQLVQHQFNDNAQRHTHNLTKNTGMQRIGVHQVRIEPGKESTTHHYHDADEEFLYILSGRGIAQIGEQTFNIEAGDFMGFPAPSPAHSLRNTGKEDLVYLMGGERNSTDVVHYPEIERSLVKSQGRRQWVAWQDFNDLPPR